MRSLTFIFCVFVILCGCSENDLLVNTNSNFDYSIEQTRFCYCINAGLKVKIFARADTIADIVSLYDNSHLPYSSWENFKTIKGLFNEIELHDTTLYTVKATYDSVYGYPTYLYFNLKPIIVNDTIVAEYADADITYKTYNYVRYK